jgi:hypothetical protein
MAWMLHRESFWRRRRESGQISWGIFGGSPTTAVYHSVSRRDGYFYHTEAPCAYHQTRYPHHFICSDLLPTRIQFLLKRYSPSLSNWRAVISLYGTSSNMAWEYDMILNKTLLNHLIAPNSWSKWLGQQKYVPYARLALGGELCRFIHSFILFFLVFNDNVLIRIRCLRGLEYRTVPLIRAPLPLHLKATLNAYNRCHRRNREHRWLEWEAGCQRFHITYFSMQLLRPSQHAPFVFPWKRGPLHSGKSNQILCESSYTVSCIASFEAGSYISRLYSFPSLSEARLSPDMYQVVTTGHC